MLLEIHFFCVNGSYLFLHKKAMFLLHLTEYMYSHLDCKYSNRMVCRSHPSRRFYLCFKHRRHEQCPTSVPHQCVCKQSAMYRWHQTITGCRGDSCGQLLHPCSLWHNLQSWAGGCVWGCWRQVHKYRGTKGLIIHP